MSVSYFERYREVHVPFLARWPGIRRVLLHTPLDWHAQLEFESVADFERFAPYEVFRAPWVDGNEEGA
jgi:hypothetical protein